MHSLSIHFVLFELFREEARKRNLTECSENGFVLGIKIEMKYENRNENFLGMVLGSFLKLCSVVIVQILVGV